MLRPTDFSSLSSVVDDSIWLTWLTRVLCGIHVLGRRWTEPGNLNDNRFVTGLCEVIPRWWFGVETTRWQSFQFRLVKLIAVPDMPCAGDYRRNPVVTMGVRCDACMCWHAKHNGINAWLVWIALQTDGLDSPYAWGARTRIAHLGELVFCRTKAFFVSCPDTMA